MADIIEECKDRNAPIIDIFTEKNFNEKYNWWLATSLNAYDRTARAWLDGYEVEKEKLYTAEFKLTGEFLLWDAENSEYQFCDCAYGNFTSGLTKGHLKNLNIWNNPAFEVEEVE